MTFEVIFTVSQPLNFLGYARNNLQEKVPHLWERDVETLFACDASIDTVLSRVPLHIATPIQAYKDSFIRKWPSIREELQKAQKRLETLWNIHSQTVNTLMDSTGFFYSDVIEVFPVMPFFRQWPRSNPLTMPVLPWTDKQLLEFLVHEILHKTSDAPHPQSLWRSLSMVFFMKKIPKAQKFLIQHALIYVAAAWVASQVLQEEFLKPHLKKTDSKVEQCIEMEKYITSIFSFFSTFKIYENKMELAEEIVTRCME